MLPSTLSVLVSTQQNEFYRINRGEARRARAFKWTHFSYDWHHTVNQCLEKLLSTLCYPHICLNLGLLPRHLIFPVHFHSIPLIPCISMGDIRKAFAVEASKRIRKRDRERKTETEMENVRYSTKCVFQFSWALHDACFLVWQTSISIKHHFIHNLLSVWRGTVFHYDGKKIVGSNEVKRYGEN